MRTPNYRALILGGLLCLGTGGWVVGHSLSQSANPVHDKALAKSVNALARSPALPQQQAPSVASELTVFPMTPPPQPEVASLETRFQHLESQMTQLFQQMHAQQSRWQEQQEELQRLATARTQPPATAPAETIDTAGVTAESEADWQLTQVARLETALSTQTFDAAESTEAIEQIATAMAQAVETLGIAAGKQSALQDASCGTTLCRLELRHDDRQTMESFVEEFPKHLDWDTDGFIDTVQHADGSISTFLYLSRNGQTLPSTAN